LSGSNKTPWGRLPNQRGGTACSVTHPLPFLTVTVNVTLAALALESVAEQLTFVRPIRKKLPERGTQVTGSVPSTTSIAVTEKRTAPPPGAGASP
jgi:hypothetical protein